LSQSTIIPVVPGSISTLAFQKVYGDPDVRHPIQNADAVVVLGATVVRTHASIVHIPVADMATVADAVPV